MTSLIRKLVTVCALTLAPLIASAQTNTTPTTSGAAPTASQPSDTSQTLKTGQLQQLVAPIALYPDPLLANVMMASTYPVEVVAADRFMQANKNLKGDRLKTAVEKKGWDKSVNELTATPSVLAMMSKQLEWTQKLGNAVLAQETEVMDAVQALRSKAQAENKLTTTKQQKVSTQRVDNRDIVRIEPAEAYAMYVPYYDPGVVYGAWAYDDYPPYYWLPPYGWGWYGGDVLAAGIFFGTAFALASWGNWWGGDCDWGHGHINVDGNHHNKWKHDANKGGNKQNASNLKGQGSKAANKQTAANRKGQGNKAANKGGNKQTASNRKGQGGSKATNRGGNKQTAANRKGQGGSKATNRGGNKQLAQNRARGGSGKNFAGTGRHSGANFASGNMGRMSYAGGGGGFGGRNFSGGNFGGGRSFSGGGFGGGRSFGGGGRGGGRGGRR